MDAAGARDRVAAAQVARLATVGADGIPHLVPVTFAQQEDHIVIAVDHKPKKSVNLRRLRNIAENPHVCILVDHYADDWTQLWWARADGIATIHENDERSDEALALLVAKYDQYREHIPEGPIIDIGVTRWTGWSYTAE
ncbi:TIGR03668 family PPOX class F420-dependent oxidoreductase [Streptosporangiaceae bacterium NEAU-GS5]|nr:TIGR03668 family PPOX class F420-dependent oxidoreductase [Streptosporangiaceae bacterium NEAU-GS5]